MPVTRTHRYATSLTWNGNLGSGTATYRSYDRKHTITVEGKPSIGGSSDPSFRGDADRWNPEELLVASLSSCHMLWYLHLASEAGIVVTDYVDHAEGTMEESAGGGRFVRVVLRPHVTLSPESDDVCARELHREAHAKCFIANSVNFPVECEPV